MSLDPVRLAPIKGLPVEVFTRVQANALSDIPVDCRGFNGVHVEVLASGSSPSATVRVDGASAAGGLFLALSDPSATQTGVTTNESFECGVGAAWVRIRILSISGTFAEGEGFTVRVTPFVLAGSTEVNISATASQNLAEVGGAAIDLGQEAMASSIPVAIASDQSGVAVTGPVTDVQLRATAVPVSGPVTDVQLRATAVPVSGPVTDAQLRATAVPVDTELPPAAALADGAANPTTPAVGAAGELYNGATWDRERGNTELTLFASAARTASVNSADQTNHNARGLHVVIDVTAIVTTPSVVFTIQGKDSVSGVYYDLLVSAAIVAVGTTVLRVYPGLTAAANTQENDVLPRTWRVEAVHADADSITYSVGAAVVR